MRFLLPLFFLVSLLTAGCGPEQSQNAQENYAIGHADDTLKARTTEENYELDRSCGSALPAARKYATGYYLNNDNGSMLHITLADTVLNLTTTSYTGKQQSYIVLKEDYYCNDGGPAFILKCRETNGSEIQWIREWNYEGHIFSLYSDSISVYHEDEKGFLAKWYQESSDTSLFANQKKLWLIGFGSNTGLYTDRDTKEQLQVRWVRDSVEIDYRRKEGALWQLLQLAGVSKTAETGIWVTFPGNSKAKYFLAHKALMEAVCEEEGGLGPNIIRCTNPDGRKQCFEYTRQ